MNLFYSMSRERVLAVASTSLLLLGGAAPVQARTDVRRCLWAHVPDQLKRSLYRAYDVGGTDGLTNVGVDNSIVERVHGACAPGSPATDARLQAIGTALVGVAIDRSAAHHLAVIAGVPYARLRGAWLALPAADRGRLVDAYRRAGESGPPDMTVAAPMLDRAARLAGWNLKGAGGETADQLFRHYVQVFLGMAQAEAYADAL